jgi:molybdopterin converting factor small subunit
VPAHVRLHLLTPQGMMQDKIEIDVGNEMRLDKLLGRLDKMGLRERGFFRAVRKGRQAVTLLLNGDRLDIAEARRTVIREGDELAILSQISGG